MDRMGKVSIGTDLPPGTWDQWVQITSALGKSVLKNLSSDPSFGLELNLVLQVYPRA